MSYYAGDEHVLYYCLIYSFTSLNSIKSINSIKLLTPIQISNCIILCTTAIQNPHQGNSLLGIEIIQYLYFLECFQLYLTIRFYHFKWPLE